MHIWFTVSTLYEFPRVIDQLPLSSPVCMNLIGVMASEGINYHSNTTYMNNIYSYTGETVLEEGLLHDLPSLALTLLHLAGEDIRIHGSPILPMSLSQTSYNIPFPQLTRTCIFLSIYSDEGITSC